jgi:hypothetical protein
MKKLTKKFVVYIFNMIYPVIIFFLKKKTKGNKKYHVSLCAIFKNEALFLKEWIEFHKIIGIDHFYLYNNESSDNYIEILKPYIDEGIISLIEWPYPQAQMQAYKHFYENYRNETDWISFLDIDEFICPKYVQTIEEWLIPYRKYPVIMIYWKMFGTSGLMKHNYDSLVIEQYTVSWDKFYHIGKCIINTDYDISTFNSSYVHHSPWVKVKVLWMNLKIPPINQFKRFFWFNIFLGSKNELQKSTIQINHYWSKSWDIYSEKMKRSDVFYKKNPKKNMEYFYFHEKENRTSDYIIFRYIINLKLNMLLRNNKSKY